MDDHAETREVDRPLAGIGAFAWKLSIGTALAIVAVVIALRLFGGSAAKGHGPPQQLDGTPATGRGATDRAMPARAPARDRDPNPAPVAAEDAITPIGRDVERRHVAGELSEAQRRFESCPGGDVRRIAWIDVNQRVLKLVQHRAGGVVVEEWFDDAGRLREALARGATAGRAWARRVSLDERGAEIAVEVAGPVPDQPPPSLVRTNPTNAFFAGAGCDR